MATVVTKKEYKTRKDLDILFAWLLFYKDNNRPLEFKKCQKQIDELQDKLNNK